MKKTYSKEMSMKQRLAVEEYIKTGDRKAALTKAGYAFPSHQHAVLKSPSVEKFIAQQISESANRIGVNLDWKMKMLKLIAVKCVNEEDPEIKASLAHAAISAISELNKMQGHYAPQVNINQNLNESVSKIRDEIKQYAQIYDVEALQ